MKVKPTQEAKVSSKSDRLFLRASATQKALINAAAQASHKTSSEFILETTLREATNTLLDQRIFVFSEQAFEAFEAALESPATPNKGIIELLSKSAPWE